MPASPKKSDPVKASKPVANVTPIAAKGNGVHKVESKILTPEPKAPAKVETPKPEMASKSANAELPAKVKKELDKWLSGKTSWNHNDWLNARDAIVILCQNRTRTNAHGISHWNCRSTTHWRTEIPQSPRRIHRGVRHVWQSRSKLITYRICSCNCFQTHS